MGDRPKLRVTDHMRQALEDDNAFPAIRHVLAQYRHTGDGEITEEQIQEAWAEFEEAKSYKRLWREAADESAGLRGALAALNEAKRD